MEKEFTMKDKKKIKAGIRKKYAKVATSPDGLFKYPTGRAGLEALQYDPAHLRAVPEAVAASYCGVGNPFSLGPIKEGESILDIGCGGGVDTIFAAMMTGPGGKVVGIEQVSEMIERARENLSLTDFKNVTLKEGSAENLPFSDQEFDVVISNGVFNLVPDKAKALSEVYRVLKPNGRLMIADQILTGEPLREKKQILKSWSQ
ncbi:MAG: methyltransferase domain-containing protein [Desulfobacterales bacterium]|jgi:SAM-dependent methyltransferase